MMNRTSLRYVCGAWCLAALVAASGCTSSTYLTMRKSPRNPLADPLQLFSRSGPQPSARTEQLLRRYDLAEEQQRNSPVVLVSLEQGIERLPDPETVHSYAEIAYVDGKRAEAAGKEDLALDFFGAALLGAYTYLFDPQLDRFRNPYDPQFRAACDLYNGSLESTLRILKRRGQLKPGGTVRLKAAREACDLVVETHGPWHPDDIGELEFVSDFEINGLKNHYHTYGLGVPLIALRRKHPGEEAAEQYYPDGLTFPMTAFLRIQRPSSGVAVIGQERAGTRYVLELLDPLTANQLDVAQRAVPLETDLTIPLGRFLDNPKLKAGKIATLGLLWPGVAQPLEGIYMVEPYDPNKIPVLMVHGLWSSPATWMEMFNDLRGLPEIRNHYQFWFYLYPTGQPFWISAAKLRRDLEQLRHQLDPYQESAALRQLVLVGHSMGGLVSKLQVVESGEDYWHIISDKKFADLKTDPETRERLARVLYFHPDPNISRVITIGTPHGGSDFANNTTRWLGRKLIVLPSKMVQISQRLIWENPDFFKNTDLLTITTSIDSLSPTCPIFPVLQRSPRAPWVTMHNIVGLISKDGFLEQFSEDGDGIVSFESSHLDDVEELVVPADHVTVHQHPRSVLEVRRILLSHLQEVRSTLDGDDPEHDHVRDHAALTLQPRELNLPPLPNGFAGALAP